jgi:flavin-dependent dehydrogenase
MRSNVDVLIVGARCAGAPLATLLARSGTSVVLVDRDELPSDQVTSTHTVHPYRKTADAWRDAHVIAAGGGRVSDGSSAR